MANTGTFEVGGKANGNAIAAADAGALTPWDTVSGAGTKYSSDAAHGTLSGEFTDIGECDWTFGMGGAGPTEYGRFYIKPVVTTTNITHGVRYSDAGDNTMCRIVVNSSGQVNICDSASGIVGTTTAAITTNTWARVEWAVTFSATVGSATIYLFTSMDSTSPTETLTVGSLNLRTTNASFFNIGILGFQSGDQVRFDSVVALATSLPGPDILPPAPTRSQHRWDRRRRI